MPEIRRFFSRLLSFFRSGRAESELAREIDAHLQLLEDQFIAKGMTPEEAGYAAKRAFGGVEQAKQRQRDMRTFRWLTGWSMDLRLGVRMMRKSPGLTIIAVIALAVGIGVSATYLEFINDLFRPKLSFPGADRLVGILNWDLAKGKVELRSLYEFASWKQQLTTVEELGAAAPIGENLSGEDGRVQPVRGWEISASAFRVVPIPPLHGRPLLADDEKPGAIPVVVIGEDLWKARFDADPLVIGRTIRFGETNRTIVGVMPRSFGFPIYGTLWTPLGLDALKTARRAEGPSIRIFGRLAAGANLGQAQAELEALAPRMDEAGVASTTRMRPRIYGGVEWVWAALSPAVLVLYSVNILFIALLGICVANVATLVFVRMATRESEITVRTALGASRGRIVAQLVAEALVLACVAAIFGVAGATFSIRKIVEIWNTANSAPLPFWVNQQLGSETVAYTALLVILASVFIGGVPALRATGRQMNARLKEAGSSGATMRFGKLWTAVIVGQVAVTVIFLIAVVTSAWATYSSSWLTSDFAFPRQEYFAAVVRVEDGASVERKKAAIGQLLRRLNNDSAVINAAVAHTMPGDWSEFRAEFPSSAGGSDAVITRAARVGANYFETLRQPLVTGRYFTGAELEEGRRVAIVDETFERLVLAGKSALGQLVRDSRSHGPWLEIVGVVKDITLPPNKTAADAILYRPAAGGAAPGETWVIVDSRSSEAAARISIAARAADPELRLVNLQTIDQHREADARQARLATMTLGILAAVALMLATAGIYALISFTLARRSREIGIRNALGGTSLRIITGVLSRAFVQIGAGLVLGAIPGVALAAALINATLEPGYAFGMAVAATAGVAVFIVAVAAISCIVPVRRALKVHPTEALRTT